MLLARRHAAVLGVALALAACGGAPVRDEDVYHEASLRPGVLPADDADRELLARLPESAADQPLEVGGRVFVPRAAYATASGRRCAPVVEQGARTRLACESAAGWVFVPDVFGGDDPFAATAGTP
ncbi:hypothetical protein [Sandaracinus amylolyticus]|nr:hypothetical protein [Sandaracinus amylolyticus]